MRILDDDDERWSPRHDAFTPRHPLTRCGAPILVRHPAGHIVELPAHVALKPGFVRVDGDETAEIRRLQAVQQNDDYAYQVDPRTRRTGRYLNLISEGEGIVPERVNDRDVYAPIVDESGHRVRDVLLAANEFRGDLRRGVFNQGE